MNVAGILVLWICLISTLVHKGNGLQCFECNKAEDRTQCKTETHCGIDENCFIERYGNLPYATFKLGCIEHQRCPTQPLQGFTLVGRDLQGNAVPECKTCCTTDNCNANYCDFKLSAPSSTTSISCTDKESDCPHLNQTAHFCTNVQDAKKLCRKYCGLCDFVDGSWNVWSAWSMCDVSCGRGTVSRKRMCNNPAPANGGLQCTGNNTETKSCNIRDCPVHGGWAPWQSWDSCSAQCGIGLTKRRRTCTSPTPTLFGHFCYGDSTETQLCNGTNCSRATPPPPPTPPGPCVDAVPRCDVLNTTLAICADREKARAVCQHYCNFCGVVDGHWTYWTDWKQCSVTCGNGTTSRSRSCTNPSPANGGHLCTGQTLQTKVCNERVCPVHGGWAMWGSWTTCTARCGTGQTHRRRDCNNPVPSLFGSYCYGDETEYSLCVVRQCPVDGKWSIWTSWSMCSTTCGSGTVSRTRECNNPEPLYGGLACTGNGNETKNCQLRNCPVDGGWSVWTSWGSCSVTCGKGLRKRTRDCNNPAPRFGGSSCIGDSSDKELCQDRTCTMDGKWNTWTSWSICSSTCGSGTVSRTRDCNNPEPLYGGVTCTGNANETQSCQLRNCPVNGIWSGWTSWGSCSATCGKGLRKRSRNCNSPTPAFGGSSCSGDSSDYELCQDRTCPTISFTVHTPSSDTYSSGYAIIFTRIIDNDGGGYSSGTGKFTAPVTGQYIFSLIVGEEVDGADVYLMKNNYEIGEVNPVGHYSDFDTASVTSTLNLHKGDTVWAKYIAGPIHASVSTSFTGVLVHP